MKSTMLFFLLGVLMGIIYDEFQFINLCTKNNIISRILTDTVFTFISGISFFYSVNHLLLGMFRLYIVIIFILGMYIERKTIGKLFAKLNFILYNVGVKLITKLKTTSFGKIIFK